MSDEECIHGLGPIEACVICNGRAQKEKAEEAGAPRVFPAKYEGHCHVCNLPIYPTQTIIWRPGEKPIHAGCRD